MNAICRMVSDPMDEDGSSCRGELIGRTKIFNFCRIFAIYITVLTISRSVIWRKVIWEDGGVLFWKYSVHLGTQFSLTPVSPVEGTETGLTGGGKKTKYKMEV